MTRSEVRALLLRHSSRCLDDPKDRLVVERAIMGMIRKFDSRICDKCSHLDEVHFDWGAKSTCAGGPVTDCSCTGFKKPS